MSLEGPIVGTVNGFDEGLRELQGRSEALK